jgi:hypothetical protein
MRSQKYGQRWPSQYTDWAVPATNNNIRLSKNVSAGDAFRMKWWHAVFSDIWISHDIANEVTNLVRYDAMQINILVPTFRRSFLFPAWGKFGLPLKRCYLSKHATWNPKSLQSSACRIECFDLDFVSRLNENVSVELRDFFARNRHLCNVHVHIVTGVSMPALSICPAVFICHDSNVVEHENRFKLRHRSM